MGTTEQKAPFYNVPSGFISAADFARGVKLSPAAIYNAIKNDRIPAEYLFTESIKNRVFIYVEPYRAAQYFKGVTWTKRKHDKVVAAMIEAGLNIENQRAHQPIPPPPPPLPPPPPGIPRPPLPPPPPPRTISERRDDPAPAVGSMSERFNAAKLQREQLAAKKAELEYRIARGLVMNSENVAGFLYTMAVEVRQALDSIIPKIAPIIAAERDTMVVTRIMEKEFTEVLSRLAKVETYQGIHEMVFSDSETIGADESEQVGD